MIALSISVDRLVIGEPSPVRLLVRNDGAGACRRVRVGLAASAGLSVREGTRSLEVPRIVAGDEYPHELVLLARRVGEHRIEVTNLSFRDEHGAPHRREGLALVLTAHAPESRPEPGRPAPRRPGTIFLSYRRADTEHTVESLAARLRTQLGAPVFHDHTSLHGGDQFLPRLDREVAACAVLLAVIGPGWLTVATGSGRRRLDEPTDLVRHEIATALRLGKRVVPVLVGSAALPDANELPPELSALPERQAIRVAPDLSAGLDRVLHDLRQVLGV